MATTRSGRRLAREAEGVTGTPSNPIPSKAPIDEDGDPNYSEPYTPLANPSDSQDSPLHFIPPSIPSNSRTQAGTSNPINPRGPFNFNFTPSNPPATSANAPTDSLDSTSNSRLMRDHFELLLARMQGEIDALKLAHAPPRPSQRDPKVKAALPEAYNGDRSKGEAFLQTARLYLELTEMNSLSFDTQILWILSYMKSDRALTWAKDEIACIRNSRPTYANWQEFEQAFRLKFFPHNELETARTILEGSSYWQGSRTVDDYTDRFNQLLHKSKYSIDEQTTLKYRKGLNLDVYTYVSNLPATAGRPKDNDLHGWMDAAIQFDETRRATETLKNTIARPIRPSPIINRSTSNTSNSSNPFIPQSSSFPNTRNRTFDRDRFPRGIIRPPPVGNLYNPNRVKTEQPEVKLEGANDKGKRPERTPSKDDQCFRCKGFGHWADNCPHRHDIRYMSVQEREEFDNEEALEMDRAESEAKEDFSNDDA